MTPRGTEPDAPAGEGDTSFRCDVGSSRYTRTMKRELGRFFSEAAGRSTGPDEAPGPKVMHVSGEEEIGFPLLKAAELNGDVDLITVPSSAIAKYIRDCGIRTAIAVAGIGVDHLGREDLPPLALPDTHSFRFLHIAASIVRDGTDTLLTAYGRAFRSRDNVSLVIEAEAGAWDYLSAYLAALREIDPEFPHILLLERDAVGECVPALYAACDAYVGAGRWTASGLLLAEAMSCGLPVIATAWGGHMDFCDETNAWLCDFRFAKAEENGEQLHMAWAEPDTDHLAALMRQVHCLAPAERQRRCSAAREHILRQASWRAAARRIGQSMAACARRGHVGRRIGWVSTWNKKCGIAAYSSFLASRIPAARLTVFADSGYEPIGEDEDNVVRCWRSGLDDDVERLLDEIVRGGVDTAVIQYNFGFYSVSALGWLVEKLKEAGIGVHCFFHSTSDIILADWSTSLAAAAPALALADRLYVHGVPDMNRLKGMGMTGNVVLFPQGVFPVPPPLAGMEKPGSLAGKKVVATYGYFLPHKGVRQVIEAFAVLARQHDDLHLLLVNALYPARFSADEKAACESLIDRLGLEDRVTMKTDFLPEEESLALLQWADLVVFAYQSTQESSSAAVRMGLASGRPVAVTPLFIFDDVAGAVHMLPGTRVADIAAGIEELLEHPDRLAAQKQKTDRWMRMRQWPLLSQRLLDIIDGIAGGAGSSGLPLPT